MNRLWNVRSLGVNLKRLMYERIVAPSALYGAETWGLEERVKKRSKGIEMKCLWSICGVTRIDRISNVKS